MVLAKNEQDWCWNIGEKNLNRNVIITINSNGIALFDASSSVLSIARVAVVDVVDVDVDVVDEEEAVDVGDVDDVEVVVDCILLVEDLLVSGDNGLAGDWVLVDADVDDVFDGTALDGIDGFVAVVVDAVDDGDLLVVVAGGVAVQTKTIKTTTIRTTKIKIKKFVLQGSDGTAPLGGFWESSSTSLVGAPV